MKKRDDSNGSQDSSRHATLTVSSSLTSRLCLRHLNAGEDQTQRKREEDAMIFTLKELDVNSESLCPRLDQLSSLRMN